MHEFYQSVPRLICVIDLNQEDNLNQAFEIAYQFVYKDGQANMIPPLDEGTVI